MMVVTPISTISTVLNTYIYSLHSIYLPLSLYTEIQIQHSVPIDTEMSPPLVPRLLFLPSRASNCHFSPFFRRCKYQLQLHFNFTSTDSVSSNIFSSISLLRCVVMAVLTTEQFLLSQCSMCDKKYEQSRSNLLSAIDRGGPYQPP